MKSLTAQPGTPLTSDPRKKQGTESGRVGRFCQWQRVSVILAPQIHRVPKADQSSFRGVLPVCVNFKSPCGATSLIAARAAMAAMAAVAVSGLPGSEALSPDTSTAGMTGRVWLLRGFEAR